MLSNNEAHNRITDSVDTIAKHPVSYETQTEDLIQHIGDITRISREVGEARNAGSDPDASMQ